MNDREFAINAEIGDYWYKWRDVDENDEPDAMAHDAMQQRLRARDLILTTDDRGVVVSACNRY